VKRGHVVRFYERDAIGGSRRRKKPLYGRVRNIDAASGLAQVGDYLIPLRRLARVRRDVYRDWQRAERKAHYAAVYKGLSAAEKRRLATCAKDARLASEYVCVGEYSGPADARYYGELKRCRESQMAARGITDTTDKGQCRALPLLIARALERGKVPVLRGVEYVSADSGGIGVGDTVTLGGHPYKLVGYAPDGKAVLKDGFEVAVPAEYVPHDKGTPIVSVFEKLKARRAARLTHLKRARRRTPALRPQRRRARRRWCYCFRRDRRGRFAGLVRR
jgi:hypothetical protein